MRLSLMIVALTLLTVIFPELTERKRLAKPLMEHVNKLTPRGQACLGGELRYAAAAALAKSQHRAPKPKPHA